MNLIQEAKDRIDGLLKTACAAAAAKGELAQGELSAHYRKGWEEKAIHGESLIGEQVRMPVRGFEGTTAGRQATETVIVPHGPDRPLPSAPAPAPAPAGSKATVGIKSNWKP